MNKFHYLNEIYKSLDPIINFLFQNGVEIFNEKLLKSKINAYDDSILRDYDVPKSCVKGIFIRKNQHNRYILLDSKKEVDLYIKIKTRSDREYITSVSAIDINKPPNCDNYISIKYNQDTRGKVFVSLNEEQVNFNIKNGELFSDDDLTRYILTTKSRESKELESYYNHFVKGK